MRRTSWLGLAACTLGLLGCGGQPEAATPLTSPSERTTDSATPRASGVPSKAAATLSATRVELEPKPTGRQSEWDFVGSITLAPDEVLLHYTFDFGDKSRPRIVRPVCPPEARSAVREVNEQHQFDDLVISTVELTVVTAASCDAPPASQRTTLAKADVSIPF